MLPQNGSSSIGTTKKYWINDGFPILNAIMSIMAIQWLKPRRKVPATHNWIPSFDTIFKFVYGVGECSLFFITTMTSFLAVTINIFPLVLYIIGWATCSYDYSSICYTLYFNYNETTNKNELPQLALRDIPIKKENNVDNNITKQEIQEFVDLSKISLLFSTTANAVSHVLFIWALWCLYIKHYKSFNKFLMGILSDCKNLCCIVESKKEDKLPLDPFNDETADSDMMEIDTPEELKKVYDEKNVDFFSTEDERTNTPLQGERLCHYVTWFIIGFMLLIITAVVFFCFYGKQNSGISSYKYLMKDVFKLEVAALALYTYSLFRVLVSCFIFSKLMYGIQRRCEELELYVIHINEAYKNDPEKKSLAQWVKNYVRAVPDYKFELGKITDSYDNTCKYYLKKRDKHFVNTAVSTLSWLQLWFLFHWILHIISTFMIMSLLIDATALHVKSKIDHLRPGVGFDPGEIGFLFMYSVVHWFLLLHPCLRAASVTRTRQRVIRKISEKAHNEYKNIPEEVMQGFIGSMKRRKFSFRLRILCARIPFNLNIAYVSIAFAFVGVVVSLINTVTH